MDWPRVGIDVCLVAVGFILAMLWDLWQRSRAWRGHKKALVEELKANEATLGRRFEELPGEIQQAVRSLLADGKTVTLEPDAYSGPIRPLIPFQIGHPFRFISATHSG